jgi:transcriptional regulator with XRE-family HTH domain
MYAWVNTPLQASFNLLFEAFEFEGYEINKDVIPKELNAEQIRALEELEALLKDVTKEELSKEEPNDMFCEPAGWNNSYTPACILYDYQSDLILTTTLLEELKERAQVEKLAHTLSVEVNRVRELIEEITDEYARTVFSSKLKYLMDKKGLAAKDVAAQLLVTPQSVSLWLNGKCYPNIPTVIALAVLLDSSLDFLLRPDSIEVSLDEDTLYKSVGLSADSTKILKELVEGKQTDILSTLNLIIGNYKGSADSLLYALTDYFKLLHNQSLHMVSDELLADLDFEVKNSKTVKAAHSAVSSYVQNQASMDYNVLVKGSAYDVDKALLIAIMQILSRMKDEVKQDFYG